MLDALANPSAGTAQQHFNPSFTRKPQGLIQSLSRHCRSAQEALRRGAAQALAALPGAVAPDALLGALAGALGAARSTRAQIAVLDFYAVLARTRALAGDPPSPAALKCARPALAHGSRVLGAHCRHAVGAAHRPCQIMHVHGLPNSMAYRLLLLPVQDDGLSVNVGPA